MPFESVCVERLLTVVARLLLLCSLPRFVDVDAPLFIDMWKVNRLCIFAEA